MNWPEMPYYRSYSKLTSKIYYRVLYSLAGNLLEPGAQPALWNTEDKEDWSINFNFSSTSVSKSVSGSAALQRAAYVREWLLFMWKISF